MSKWKGSSYRAAHCTFTTHYFDRLNDSQELYPALHILCAVACMVNVLPTNTYEGAIRTVSCGHCSILTGTFIEHSIVIITAVSKSTDVRSLCALIDIWLLNGMSVATSSNNSISYTNACESAICISPCNHCSILTSTFIKCSTIFNTAVAKPTDGRILCTFIDIWLKNKESS